MVHTTRSRIERVREVIEDGRRRDGSLPGYVVAELVIMLDGLEDDLTAQPIGVRCGNCGLRFRWPGELDDHLRFVHWGAPWRKTAAA